MNDLKKNNKDIESLGEDLTDFLGQLSPINLLVKSFVFVYKGQCPNVALYVVSGSVIIGDESICVEPGDKGLLLALSDLLERRPSLHQIKVLAGSRLCTIDRSCAEEALKFKSFKLKPVKA